MLLRRALFVLFLAFAVVETAPVAYAGNQTGAEQFIEGLAKQTVSILESQTDMSHKDAELKQLFSGNIAMEWVGRFVLGRHWRDATEAQKQAYLESYKSFITNSYVNRLKEYSGEKFHILQTKDMGENRFMLSIELVRPNNKPPVSFEYKVREEGGRYQIFDIVVEGVSLITTQRSEFDAVVARKGIDYLIEQLQAKAKANAAT